MGGATPLLAHVPANANGTFRFRCEGEGEIAAVPLRANGEIVGWAVGLTAPQLTVDLPSGNSKTVDDVTLAGFLAPTIADLSKTVSALYGAQFIGETEKNLIFEASYTTQRALYRNYPDPAFMRQLALSGGMSEVNAARMGQLYAGDVANKQTVLLDVITSADEAYLKAVVGATISSLYLAGLDTEQIAQLFAQETNGRITVQFGGVGNGPWTVAVINQGNGSATVHAPRCSLFPSVAKKIVFSWLLQNYLFSPVDCAIGWAIMSDFLSVVFWFGFLCCFPVLIIAGPVGFVLYRNKQRREGSEAIAQALGLQPTAKAKQMQWYEGRLNNGRLLAYVPIIFKRHYYNHDGAASFLLFEYQVVNPSPEEIEAKTAELSRLAQLYET